MSKDKKETSKRKRPAPVDGAVSYEDGSAGYEDDGGTVANDLRELLADATPEDVGRALLRPVRRSQ